MVKIIDDEMVEIKGNFKRGQRMKTIKILKRTIDEKSWRKFINIMQRDKKFFEFKGACPKCSSLRVKEIQSCIRKFFINDPNDKGEIYPGEMIYYKCERCNNEFNEGLKKVNIIMYY